jgi:hypothetical protein
MSKFNFSKHRDTMAGHLFIRAITESKLPIEKFQSKQPLDDVKLIVNGIEVDFKSTIDSLDKHIDEEIVTEAKRMVDELLDDKMEKVGDALDELTDHLKEQLKKPLSPES